MQVAENGWGVSPARGTAPGLGPWPGLASAPGVPQALRPGGSGRREQDGRGGVRSRITALFSSPVFPLSPTALRSEAHWEDGVAGGFTLERQRAGVICGGRDRKPHLGVPRGARPSSLLRKAQCREATQSKDQDPPQCHVLPPKEAGEREHERARRQGLQGLQEQQRLSERRLEMQERSVSPLHKQVSRGCRGRDHWPVPGGVDRAVHDSKRSHIPEAPPLPRVPPVPQGWKRKREKRE